MSKYLWIQSSIVAAGVFFSAIAGQVSGIAWALCAGFWIWQYDRERQRADEEEYISDRLLETIIRLKQIEKR